MLAGARADTDVGAVLREDNESVLIRLGSSTATSPDLCMHIDLPRAQTGCAR